MHDRSRAGPPFRYAFLDATYCKARVDHRVLSQAVVVATGIKGTVRRARRCPAACSGPTGQRVPGHRATGGSGAGGA
jgi:hypothetical protein